MKRVLPPLPAKPKVRTVLLESLNPSTDSGPSSAWGPPGYFELLKGHALCDCVLRTDDGGVFKAHRVRLCSLSRFFLVLYTHSFNREPPRDVRLRGVKTNTLMQLLTYCYMGQIRITNENVEDILDTSDMLMIEDLVNLCCGHLEKEMSVGNCLGMYRLAVHYYCPRFREKVLQFVCEHFAEVTRQSHEFVHLPFEWLHAMLSMDDLNIRNEHYLIDVVRRWGEFQPLERAPFLTKLLQCVRIGRCTPEGIRASLRNNPYIGQHSGSREALVSVTRTGCSMCNDRRAAAADSASQGDASAVVECDNCTASRWRFRIPNQLIFVVGGWAETRATNVMETYDVRADHWVLHPDGGILPRAYHGLVMLEDLLYMLGGFDGETCFNSVQCYNPKLRIWTQRACMNQPRCYVSVATLDGFIYAAGGFTGHTRTNTVEKYYPRINQWYPVPSMHKRRSDASCCAFNGKLYVAGGFTGTRVLSSVEVYDPLVNTWTYVEPMLSARSGFRLISYANTLYAIGGFDGSLRLTSVERYRSDSRRWELKASMRLGRSNFAAAILEDTVYIMGGFNGHSTVSDVECYCHHTDIWRRGVSLNISRSAFSACVFKGLEFTKQYSYSGTFTED